MSDEKDLFPSKHFRLEEIQDGIYSAVAKVEEGGDMANAGLIDLGDSVLVFDSFQVPGSAKDLLAAIDKVIGKPVRYLVNSHFHSDHIQGNYLFPPETAIISTRRTRELIEERAPGFLQWVKEGLPSGLDRLAEARDQAQDEKTRRHLAAQHTMYGQVLASIDEIVLRLPDVLFKDRLVIHGSERVVEALEYSGHTESDIVLYLPEERIAFTSELVVVRTHPYMPDSDQGQWITALDKVKALGIDVLVPGHGPVGTPDDIDVMPKYFDAMEQLAKAIIAEGGSASDAAHAPAPPDYADWWDLAYPYNMHFLHSRLSES